MTALPPGWRLATVDELTGGVRANVTIGPFGSSLKVSDYRDSGVPLVFVRNIRSKRFGGEGAKFVAPEKARELQSHEVIPGDVLITKMGDPPGDSAVYRGQSAAIITADCIRLRTSEDFISPITSLWPSRPKAYGGR
jgi:type I restriction enzyme S subunit